MNTLKPKAVTHRRACNLRGATHNFIGRGEGEQAAVRSILTENLVQTRLDVGATSDRFEREADQVADRVGSGLAAPSISRLPTHPSIERKAKAIEEEKKPVQRAAAKATEEERKQVRRLLQGKVVPAADKREDDKRLRRKEARKPEGEKKVQRKEVKPPEDDKKAVRRQLQEKPRGADSDKPDEKKSVQRQAQSASDPGPDLDTIAQRAIENKGAGRPLEPATRSRLEASMGVDFGAVRVHDDANARSAAQSLNARAFTHGSDIWLGPGESQRDTKLMAHEATHVMQQQSGLVQRVVQRAATASDTGSGPLRVKNFYLPKIKERLLSKYADWNLARVKGYQRGNPDQKDSVWLDPSSIKLPAEKILNRLDIDISKLKGIPKMVEVSIGGDIITLGEHHPVLEDLKIPLWNSRQKKVSGDNRFEVDHQVELQVAGWPVNKAANTMKNLELLDRKSNGTSGGDVNRAIRVSVAEQLQADGAITATDTDETKKKKVRDVLHNRGATFDKPVTGWPKNALYQTVGDALSSESTQWDRTALENGEHIDLVQPVKQLGEAGNPDRYALLLPARSVKLDDFKQDRKASSQQIEIAPKSRKSIVGLTLTGLTLEDDYRNAQKGAKVGTLDVEVDPSRGLKLPSTLPSKLNVLRQERYTGYIDGVPSLTEGELEGASPVVFSRVSIAGGRLSAVGRLNSTIPLLQRVPLELRLAGRNIELAYTYDAGELNLPVPGLTVDESSLSVSFGTNGLGAGGEAQFSIERLGSGRLGAQVTSGKGFEAEGSFSFDSKLFDQAAAEVWYRNKAFGGRGTLSIDKPDRIRGIRSANITAEIEAGKFKAQGTVMPAIPGVEQGDLRVDYSEAQGLLIAGKLQLGKGIPGIRSGMIDVSLRKVDQEWKVKGEGVAQPAIPGVDSQLKVSYDDGAFDASFEGAFQRGMLAGSVGVGVTNRSLDAAGAPTGAPAAANPLLVYGKGTATVKIAPWLQGTAGIRFAPNGEVTVAGEIGLPGQLQVFPRKQLDKSLFNIAIQAPIMPGIVAEIGGGLSAQAGIGPGVIDQLRIGIEYNPAHEENTHVHGDGHLSVPADAGLRLAVRAGIGLGITGASATGGLEIGGMLGLGGAAEAGVHVDWTPTKGLRLDAVGDIHAEPKFKFDIGGYVSVRALGLSIYDRKWNLAAYEFGSNLRFGVRFPIHYVEGSPFDLSLNDVEFTVPEINTEQLLKGLVREVAGGG